MCDISNECGILAVDFLRTKDTNGTHSVRDTLTVSRSLLEKFMVSASLVGRVDVVVAPDFLQAGAFEGALSDWLAKANNTDFEYHCSTSQSSFGILSNALNWAHSALDGKSLSLLIIIDPDCVVCLLLGKSSSIKFDPQCKLTALTSTTQQLTSLVAAFASKCANHHFLRKSTDTHLLQLDYLLFETSVETNSDYHQPLEEGLIEASFREKYLLRIAKNLPSSPTAMWMDLIQLLVERGEELSGQHLVMCSRSAVRTSLQSVFFTSDQNSTHPLCSLGHIQSVLRASLHAQQQELTHQGVSSECDSVDTFSAAPTSAPNGRSNVKVVITGISAALPGRNADVFTPGVNNIRRIINGECFITPIPDHVKDAMLEKNVITQRKNAEGTLVSTPLTTHAQSINVSATLGEVNLSRYGVSESIVSTMDRAVQVSIAAGLEALRDAGLVSGTGSGTSGWELPEHMRSTTGVVYATSFPALDTAIAEVTKFFAAREVKSATVSHLVAALRARLTKNISPEDALSAGTEAALRELEHVATEAAHAEATIEPYAFDRKFLFRVLVLGNAQLAQIIKARGPNMQTNAACAGATQAIALAYDMIQVGRAERVVVIAGDSASSDNLLPWLGNGFRILGAATTTSDLTLAAKPFGAARTGMILGSGGIGMVLESEAAALQRHRAALAVPTLSTDSLEGSATNLTRAPFKCRLLGTLLSNSAYHGASMDKVHIADELERFVSGIEVEHGITRQELAAKGVYFSHETGTHASPATSCAANEIYALRKVFGPALSDLLILNTKGFTGHPMGVSFEDVVAVEVLTSGTVPPIANFTSADPYLGSDLKFSTGGAYEAKYALRFAAGFGSHIALALYGVA